jgi:hypothetical protein
MLRTPAAIVCVAVVAMATMPAAAQTLRGSSSSVNLQHRVAIDHDYTFLAGTSDVNRFVELGLLVPIKGGTNYEIHAVSFPYGRPAVQTFIERLSAQYRSACGEKLVVTSLTRPTTRQPRNASDMSVHPAGMAVDLRISNRTSCRRWLESTLLSLEKTGVLEATRERNPAHYHVAVFPSQYLGYVDRLVARSATRLASTRSAEETPDSPSEDDATASDSGSSADAATPTTASYRVSRGDTLWSIARAHGTTVAELKSLNGLASSRIKAGQTLTVPTN